MSNPEMNEFAGCLLTYVTIRTSIIGGASPRQGVWAASIAEIYRNRSSRKGGAKLMEAGRAICGGLSRSLLLRGHTCDAYASKDPSALDVFVLKKLEEWRRRGSPAAIGTWRLVQAAAQIGWGKRGAGTAKIKHVGRTTAE